MTRGSIREYTEAVRGRYLLASKEELAATYNSLNPVLLLKQIKDNLEHLRTAGEGPFYRQRKVKTYEASVTSFMTQPCPIR